MAISEQVAILALCFQLLTLTLSAFVYLPLLLYRQVVILINHFWYSKTRGQILPARSGIYAVCDPYNKTSCQGVLVSVITVRGLITAATLQSEFNSKVLAKQESKNPRKPAYPELQQQLTQRFGFYFLVPASSFHISHHIRNVPFPPTKPGTSEKQHLETLYESWLTAPFKPGSSPWEFLVSQSTDSDLTYLIFRMHHCLGDGFAITQLLVHDLCGLAKTRALLAAPTLKVELKWAQLVQTMMKIPYDFVQQAIQCYDSPTALFSRKCASMPAYFHSAVSDLIHVEDVKKLKDAHPGSSFSSIVYAALTSALRQFCIQTFPSSPIPDQIHVSIPVLFPRETERIQNKHGFAILKLPVGTSDHLMQLNIINDWIQQVKKSTLPLTNAASFPLTGALPASMIHVLGRNRWTTALSSVFPGPKDALILADNFRVEEFSFSAGLLGFEQGIGFFALTYRDRFRIIATVDKRICSSKTAVQSITNHAFQRLKLGRWN